MKKPQIIPATAANVRRAFTLVELMVVIVIIGVISALTLAGLSGVRQRAREDKTKSTIRKIDAVIRPMYESYRSRRVNVAAGLQPRDAAIEKLRSLRLLMTREMPDSWLDAMPAHPPATASAAERRYGAYYTQLVNTSPRFSQINPGNGETFGNLYAPAETLYMIVALGGFEPDALEMFRPDEIGDIDGDGAAEFHDGWGRPIMFVRWPIGHPMPLSMSPSGVLPLQTVPEEFAVAGDVVRIPDPMDPWKVTATGTSNNPSQFFDPALIPLIYSAGADEAVNDPLGRETGFGVQPNTVAWSAMLAPGNAVTTWKWAAFSSGQNVVPAAITNPSAAADNITNYDLLKP